MSSCFRNPDLFNINRIGKLSTRDGGVSADTAIFLPFYAAGYWYPSGQTLTFPRSTIPQEPGLTLEGTIKANTFQKDCCTC